MTKDSNLWYAIAVSNVYNPIRDPDLLSSNESTMRVLEAAMAEGQRAASSRASIRRSAWPRSSIRLCSVRASSGAPHIQIRVLSLTAWTRVSISSYARRARSRAIRAMCGRL